VGASVYSALVSMSYLVTVPSETYWSPPVTSRSIRSIWKAGAGKFPPYHPRRPDVDYQEMNERRRLTATSGSLVQRYDSHVAGSTPIFQ
jgi:hypothetical protein